MNLGVRLIPPAILQRTADREALLNDLARYSAMPDSELFHTTLVCLHNLQRLDALVGPDAELQLVLVPELWNRLLAGTRDMLRRITSTLAEYDPSRPSLFAFMKESKMLEQLGADAEDLRERINCATKLDTQALVEQVRFAIAGSNVRKRWAPTDFVYESGFVYRLVPAIAGRVLERDLV